MTQLQLAFDDLKKANALGHAVAQSKERSGFTIAKGIPGKPAPVPTSTTVVPFMNG